MRHSDPNAIRTLCTGLGLPPGHEYSQDWVYEIPAEFRTAEHLRRYLAAYATPSYGTAERQILMHFMLDITNDLLGDDEAVGLTAWTSVSNLLRGNRELHRDELQYWSLPGEPLEDAFALTPLIRDLARELD